MGVCKYPYLPLWFFLQVLRGRWGDAGPPVIQVEEPANDEWLWLLLNIPPTSTITTTLIPPSLPPSLMALWGVISLSLHCWVCLRSAVIVAAAGTASLPNDKPGGPLDWLLSDKGPFHHSPEYIDFVEKNRQGFSTRYKIYRWVMTAAWRGTSHCINYCYQMTCSPVTQSARLFFERSAVCKYTRIMRLCSCVLCP